VLEPSQSSLHVRVSGYGSRDLVNRSVTSFVNLEKFNVTGYQLQWLIGELGLTRQSFGGKAVMLDFVKIRNTLNVCTCCNRHLAWVGLDDEPPSSSACPSLL
jgi:hypothetical protein